MGVWGLYPQRGSKGQRPFGGGQGAKPPEATERFFKNEIRICTASEVALYEIQNCYFSNLFLLSFSFLFLSFLSISLFFSFSLKSGTADAVPAVAVPTALTPPIEGFGFPDFFPSGVSRNSRLFSTPKWLEIQTFSPDIAQSVGNPTFSIMLTRNLKNLHPIYTSPCRRVRKSRLFPDKFGPEIQAFWRFALGNPEIFRI